MSGSDDGFGLNVNFFWQIAGLSHLRNFHGEAIA